MTANGAGTCGADDNQAQAGHLIGFDLAQITSAENRSNPQPGDPQPPLAATGRPAVARLPIAVPIDMCNAARASGTGAGTQGDGWGEDGDPAYTVTGAANARPTVAVAFGHWQGLDPQASTTHTPTLRRGGGGGGVADGTAVRRLTPVECERLQGFPDDWTAGQSDSTRYRQLGNAVAVPCLTWVTQRIAAAQHRIDHDRQEH